MSNKSIKKTISPSKYPLSKSPKRIRVDIPKAPDSKPLQLSSNSPSSSRRNIKCRQVNILATSNTSPRGVLKKILRNDSSKRKLPRTSPRQTPRAPQPTRKAPRNASPRNMNPETGSSPQLSNVITRVKSQQLHTKNMQLTPEEVEARSEVFYKEHLFATFQALKFVRNLSPVDLDQLQEKKLTLQRRPGYEGKRLVVFDLDETLVHCCDDVESSDPDFVVPINFPTGEVIEAGLNLRPFVVECLTEANKNFEVAVFTASHQCYADVVLDYIDPTRELIHHRLYRDNCIYVDGIYVKDLRVFGNRELRDIVIVDNAAYSFAYQLDQGIPIISWHDDYYDRELFNLIDYLKLLAQVKDMREINKETFHMQTYYEDYMQEIFGRETDTIVRSRSPDIMNDLARKNNS